MYDNDDDGDRDRDHDRDRDRGVDDEDDDDDDNDDGDDNDGHARNPRSSQRDGGGQAAYRQPPTKLNFGFPERQRPPPQKQC